MTNKISSKGIEFEPFIWDFSCDGMWGRIFFLVPKGTFKPENNNGAYADDVPSLFIPPSICSYEQEKYQLVYVAVSCVPIGKDDTGDNCEKYELKNILQESANWIATNLTVADNTNRFRRIKDVLRDGTDSSSPKLD
jgi:hypothetical protein